MVALLRAKPGGDAFPVVVGDLADVAVPGPYPLVYLVFNTLFNLTGKIDELAAQAGLRLAARYANWQRDPFGPDSRDHISVYRKP
jgi:hypothetical protein